MGRAPPRRSHAAVTTPASPGHRRVVALAVATVSMFLFVALTVAVLSGNGVLASMDALAAQALGQQAHAGAGPALSIVSALHVPRGILILTALSSAVLLWRRDRPAVLLLWVVVLGGATLNHLLKHTIQRPRPGQEHAVNLATDFGFPSGHAANATLLYGALVMLLMPHLRSPRARVAVVLAAVLLAALVGISRVALGAHRLSDVVAGALLGIGWLSLCWAFRAGRA